MRRRRLREADEASIDLTPMLDVTFNMLIFFIVTASFVKEAGIEVNRPAAVTAERQERGSILIAIAENGQVWIDKRPVDVRAVGPNVERLRAELPQASVVVQADRGSKNGVLVEVMDAVRQAGVADISLAADVPP
jgi:biopolymer transport protein ExbD